MKSKLNCFYLLVFIFCQYLNTVSASEKTSANYVVPDTAAARMRVGHFDEKLLGTALDTGWKKGPEIKITEFIKGADIWIRLVMPDSIWRKPAFSLYGFFSNLKIYLDSELIFDNEKIHGKGRVLKTYVIPLPERSGGKYLYLRTTIENLFYLGEVRSMYVGEADALFELKEKTDQVDSRELIIDTMTGSVLCFLCVFSLFIFFNRFSLRLYPFLLFGIICLCVGIEYMVSPMASIALIDIHYGNYSLISGISLFVLAPVFTGFLEMMLGKGWKSLIRRLWQLSAVITIVFIVALIIDLRNIVYFPDLNIFYTVQIVILTAICIKSGFHKNKKVKPVIFGLGLFLVTALMDLLQEPLKINTGGQLTGVGVLALAFALGHLLLKYYIGMIERFQLARREVMQKNTELERLKEDNLRSQYEALKNQVNPHFLFNTFSTLISIIEDDPGEAVEFVQKLSNVYRYVLQCQEKQLIELSAELEFVKSYAFLLIRRFENSFTINLDVPEKADGIYIVPLVLQMLIENVLKHNVISTKKPMNIDIIYDADKGYITVRNILQRKNTLYPATKLGLRNIISRYSYFTEKPVEILEDIRYFTVHLPALQKENEDESSNN